MPDNLTIMCCDWGIGHGRLVLRQGSGPDVSHGMCERCQLLFDARLRLDARAFQKYREYLQGPLDPRD